MNPSTKAKRLAGVVGVVLLTTVMSISTGWAETASEDQYENGDQSAGRQDGSLRGETATIILDDAGEVESIDIAFACEAGESIEVAPDASVTLEDSAGEEFTYTNGEDIQISGSGEGISIESVSGDALEATSGDGDPEGAATVSDSSGISCGADSGDDADDGRLSCPTGQTATDIVGFSDSVTDLVEFDTETFTTSGSSFEVRYQATSTGADTDRVRFEAALQNESGEDTGESFTLPEGEDSDRATSAVNLPAGTYMFRVVAENAQYDITVSECGSESSGDPSDDVIDDTVPDKVLINTGGVSLFGTALGVAFVCAGAALLLSRRVGGGRP
ncbi:MAG: hypothetical protein ACRDSJ_25015 [Rubrobacteraceae bacterium]